MKDETRSRLSALGYAVWLVAFIVPAAIMNAWHEWVPADPKLESAAQLADLHPPKTNKSIQAIHVWLSNCECSQLIAKKMLSEIQASPDRHHIVLIGTAEERADFERSVGSTWSTALKMQDLRKTFYENRDEFASKNNWIGGPSVILTRNALGGDAAAQVIYYGGYSPQRPTPRDGRRLASLITEAEASKKLNPYPTFGCAIGRGNSRKLDPFNWKRWLK